MYDPGSGEFARHLDNSWVYGRMRPDRASGPAIGGAAVRWGNGWECRYRTAEDGERQGDGAL